MPRLTIQEDTQVNIKTRIWRAFALGTTAMLVAIAMTPMAAAQSQLNVRSVGEIFVDAQGRASGQNVETLISETQGVLSGFMSLSLGEEIFSSVSIDGFAQAEKIQGVGSSSLVLRGSNAVVSLFDNINTAMKVYTTSPTTIHYELAGNVIARAGPVDGVIDLHRDDGTVTCSAQSPQCDAADYLGSLFIVGNGGKLSFLNGAIDAHVGPGAQVVFLAKPIYLQAPEFHQELVAAAAEGQLVAHYVTEFGGSGVQASQVDYAPLASARTTTAARGVVETGVQSRAEGSSVLAYDLAYESLPARSSEDVSVYVDGQLAARADDAAQVRALAADGVASYYAFVQNGRSEILASTPSYSTASEHKITITASASASTAAQAQAEERARQDSRAYGDFEWHENGKLTGDFLTSIVQEGSMQLHSYTTLDTRTEIFKNIAIAGTSAGSFRAIDAHTFQMSAPEADLTLVDDVYATMIVAPKAPVDASFEPSTDVKAFAEASGVLRLEGPNGYVGRMVLVQPEAPSTSATASKLDVNAQGRIEAHLEEGSSLVYRSAPEPFASEAILAKAVAQGELGAQVLAGLQGPKLGAISTPYYQGVAADVTAQGRGAFDVDYQSHVPSAKSFAFDARGIALAAKTASDIRVIVDGKSAILVSSPTEVLALAAYPKYFAETSLDGALRVIVNTAAAQGELAKVSIVSKLDAAAKASANKDAFGAFKLFNDGTAVGSFVTLKADQKAGAVSDFTMISTGETVFSSIAAGASSFFSAGADGAPTLGLENREAKMEFSDTTNAFTKIVAKQPTDVDFSLAPDVNAQSRTDAVLELSTAGGEHIGSMIITTANGEAAKGSYFLTDGAGNVKANLEQGAQILFRTHVGIESELSGAQRTMINQAIATGNVAGHVVVQTQHSLSEVAAQAAATQARLEATSRVTAESAVDTSAVAVNTAQTTGSATAAITASYYQDVQMLTAATKNRVDVTISSTADVGKTIIVSLDPATVSGMASGNAEILFDGHVATQASSYSDILNANDDAGAAEYFVLAGEAGTQVLVSIPHFSVHTVTLKERDAQSTPLYMVATLVLGVIVLAETAFIVARRRA